jgi:CheY-like chemotaxis protein
MTIGALRILVVEDEMTIALLLEDMLIEMGHEVRGLAMRLPQALDLARRLELDFAILDINLDGRSSFAVADVLSARDVPFIFASGYGAQGLEPPYQGHPVLPKPFDQALLRDSLATHAPDRAR